jgi:acyl-[acyl-carrier-protein] desaturase
MPTRALDPVTLERGRMAHVSLGQTTEKPDPMRAIVYLTLQELATRISHRNTGKMIGDPVGYAVMARVAADENLHHLFYRDLASEALEIDPSTMVEAVADEVRDFAMPGTGIPDFELHAKAIARVGIYDLAIHYEQILVPVVLRHWRVDQLTDLTPRAEEARERLMSRLARFERIARRLTDTRAEPALSA